MIYIEPSQVEWGVNQGVMYCTVIFIGIGQEWNCWQSEHNE